MTRPFKGLRTDTTEMATALRPLVEHSDIIEDIRLGQIPGFIIALSDSFFFQPTEE